MKCLKDLKTQVCGNLNLKMEVYLYEDRSNRKSDNIYGKSVSHSLNLYTSIVPVKNEIIMYG